jgi:hypothetical protein
MRICARRCDGGQYNYDLAGGEQRDTPKEAHGKADASAAGIGAVTLVFVTVAATMALGGYGAAKTAPERVQPAAPADRATQNKPAALVSGLATVHNETYTAGGRLRCD